jgi:hypothetical protein
VRPGVTRPFALCDPVKASRSLAPVTLSLAVELSDAMALSRPRDHRGVAVICGVLVELREGRGSRTKKAIIASASLGVNTPDKHSAGGIVLEAASRYH